MRPRVAHACTLCGNEFPEEDDLWVHACPEWDRIRRENLPALESHRRIKVWLDRQPVRSWRRRLILWDVRRTLGEDADVVDALIKLGPEYCARICRQLDRIDPDGAQLTPEEEAAYDEYERRRREVRRTRRRKQLPETARETLRRAEAEERALAATGRAYPPHEGPRPGEDPF